MLGQTFALHIAYSTLSPGIFYGPLRERGEIAKHIAKSVSSALLSEVPKQTKIIMII